MQNGRIWSKNQRSTPWTAKPLKAGKDIPFTFGSGNNRQHKHQHKYQRRLKAKDLQARETCRPF